jgi:hypothetical protein
MVALAPGDSAIVSLNRDPDFRRGGSQIAVINLIRDVDLVVRPAGMSVGKLCSPLTGECQKPGPGSPVRLGRGVLHVGQPLINFDADFLAVLF